MDADATRRAVCKSAAASEADRRDWEAFFSKLGQAPAHMGLPPATTAPRQPTSSWTVATASRSAAGGAASSACVASVSAAMPTRLSKALAA